MKKIFKLRYPYIARVGIFLIALALIVGTVSCSCGPGGATYTLQMAVAPPNSGTATDLDGASPYASGTAVNISAAAAPCYQFVGWTSSAGGQFGNPNDPTTNFTMPANDVTVTANFAIAPLDHFRVYDVYAEADPNEDVELIDQFGAYNATVRNAVAFFNPVKKEKGAEVTPISNDNNHYMLYLLEFAEPPEEQYLQVTVNNQFGDNQELIVISIPIALAVPTQKAPHDPWDCLDHLLVYYVYDSPETPASVNLEDQFGAPEQGVNVYYPVLFANPVQKTRGQEVTDIVNPNVQNHMVFYLTDEKVYSGTVDISNQFSEQLITVDGASLLAVPSEKTSWGRSLDHFTSYAAMGTPFDQDVRLVDQWVDITTTVTTPALFCNPAIKYYNDKETYPWYWDDHLMVYNITNEEFGYWEVWVNNQFGDQQWLTVKGPVALAVPTWKLYPGEHDPPEGLDHYALYEVTDYEPSGPPPFVLLSDQFIELVPPYEPVPVDVLAPAYFAIPVEKTKLPDGDPTEIVNETAHLLFYKVMPPVMPWMDIVVITNQFIAEDWLGVFELQYLAVPSVKASYNPVQPG